MIKGYEISCFYMEADKTVTYPLTVSMRSLEPFTELAEMPRCQYEVVDPLTMEPLSVVSVGNKLLHKWTCDSTAPSLHNIDTAVADNAFCTARLKNNDHEHSYVSAKLSIIHFRVQRCYENTFSHSAH